MFAMLILSYSSLPTQGPSRLSNHSFTSQSCVHSACFDLVFVLLKLVVFIAVGELPKLVVLVVVIDILLVVVVASRHLLLCGEQPPKHPSFLQPSSPAGPGEHVIS